MYYIEQAVCSVSELELQCPALADKVVVVDNVEKLPFTFKCSVYQC